MEVSKIVEDLITECERMSSSLNEHLQQLYALAGQLGIPTKRDRLAPGPGADIRAEIERRRQELMAQVEQARAQAQAQAIEVRKSIGDHMSNVTPGMMSGMGMMPGMMPGTMPNMALGNP